MNIAVSCSSSSSSSAVAGCAMFTAWKTIPPPGGCDQCHTVPISNNWQVTYQAPT